MAAETPRRHLEFADLVVVDDIIPSDFSPFRTIEYTHYLRVFNAAVISLEGWHPWIGNESFAKLLDQFPIEPDLKARIVPFETNANIEARLAYVTFLNNAIRLMPYFESRRLPFILQLYPGGGFEIGCPDTDQKLRRVLLSEYCRRVIVTQRITEQYITDRIGCDPTKISYIFGGVFESRQPFTFARDKIFYPKDKPTFDVCFVAHKYGKNLTAKGYDQFVAIAIELAATFPQVRFHVVGDYLPEDVPLSDYSSRFTFHGRRSSAFLAEFYRSMDAIVSVTRPFDLTRGSFDGFPTGACIEAGFHGVVNCINDPLHLNPCFTDGQDIVLLNFDHLRSADRLRNLVANPADCYRIAEQGCRRFREIFDTDRQLQARTQIISEELIRPEALAVPSALDADPVERAPLPRQAPAGAALEATDNQHLPGGVAFPGTGRAAAHKTEELRIQVAILADHLDAIMSSTSWRLTAPLRRALGPYPGTARLARRTAKVAWWALSLRLASRYRTWSDVRRQTGGGPRQRRPRAEATEEHAVLGSLSPRPPSPNEPAAENEGTPFPPADGPPTHPREDRQHHTPPPPPAEDQERLEQLESRVETLLPSLDRLSNLEREFGHIRWLGDMDRDRLDWALGALAGMVPEIDAYHAARDTDQFRAAFEVADPLVSVCVATMDRADLLLARCIPSLLAQTHRNIEIIVVGDNCTDDTAERLAAVGDPRIRFENLPQRGPYPPPGRDRWYVAGTHAMNQALSRCAGEFVTHIDDDDSMVPHRIATLVAAAREAKADFLWHPLRRQNRDGTWILVGNGRLEMGYVGTGSLFYHRYFARFPWDVMAYRLREPGDWNRIRRIKLLRPRLLYVDEPLASHHAAGHSPFTAREGERFLE